MSMRMLIDARHPEETRVAVAKGSRIEEFDFESSEHKQLKGNIYLAKVTRVEPSLQAAFVDYGGNRHGFLAFSEIHPDYYQIPKADRDALLAEEAAHAAEEERLRSAEYDDAEDAYDAGEDAGEPDGEQEHEGEAEGDEAAEVGTGSARSPVDESAAEELRKKRQALRRRYKIQDVIQRRQVLLVQVVKEERGNKGAALTTYLSLAGRYCVLMPNTSHGGGISRKISNGADRKRLKSIIADLKLPSTMGLIVRTAGLQRTKVEIKRDFDYLARLWDEVRERTLSSSAPALIYRDSDLIKRAIRDLYHREIEEVVVEGDEGFKAARGFMKLLMPSHVRRVQQYADPTPIFQRYGVEDQLTAMYQPVVQLKSGGYLVINPTEALVSIDINSGRSTREHNIEQTAYATNIEAAHEIARQLRLRDMAGLIVIDFIDMEQSSHVRKVEKAMKEALKNDRARIQVGRISGFGLMEMSRQRLRTGVLEASTKACPHCEGTGLMRTASSAGLSALRIIEDEAARGRGDRILLRAGSEAAIYVLNRKRGELAEIEERYGVTVEIAIEEMFEGARMTVESSGPRPQPKERPAAQPILIEEEDEYLPEEDEVDVEAEEAEEAETREERTERDEDGDGGRKRRRRRRRGGRGRRRDGEPEAGEQAEQLPETAEEAPEAEVLGAEEQAEERPSEAGGKPRRRGGRGRGRKSSEGEPAAGISPEEPPMADLPLAEEPVPAENVAEEEKPKTRRRPRARKAAPGQAEGKQDVEAVAEPAPVAQAVEVARAVRESTPADEAAEEGKPKRKTRAKKAAPSKVEGKAEDAPVEATPSGKTPTPEPSNEDAPTEPRRGWWQRTFG
ncbi:MAG TPA: Rne/Rng family ribonuclease [Sphingomicrobium sp.]